jgi:hypothetical protein
MQDGAYPKKKKKSVEGSQFAVKYMSETYYWTQRLNREDYGVDKYLKTKQGRLRGRQVLLVYKYFLLL